MWKGVNFRTFFFFNLYCSHISSSFHHLKWKKYTCNKTRNQRQKGTKSIHSWELWPKIYLGKNKHALLVALGKRYFFLQLWGISMNLKIIDGLIGKENLSLISHFLAAWFVMLFSTKFSLSEHQIKQESSTYKKRPQGQ